MSETVFPLRSRRFHRSMRAQALSHLSPGILLVEAGFETLHEIPLLGAFQILAAGTMLIVTFRELKAKHHHPDGADVILADLFASAMMLAEGLHRAHRGGHYLPYAYVGLSIFMAVRAYAWKHLAEHRRLVLTEDGFTFGKRFGTIRLKWTAMKSVKVKGELIEVLTDQGRQIIDLSKFEHSKEIIAGFCNFAAQREIPLL